MARKQQKLTFEIYLDGVRVEKIPPEAWEKMSKRMGAAVSLYYTQHPEEYEKLLKGEAERERARGGQASPIEARPVEEALRHAESR